MFPKKPADVLKMIKDNEVLIVDFRFLDFIGMWQHFSISVKEFNVSMFEEGLGFDGSSIRGWQSIHASDMLMIPDPTTARIDPFFKHPTLVLLCDIVDPITREPYSRDPRNIAKKTISYLKGSGIGDTAYIGPELEFFLIDDGPHVRRAARELQGGPYALTVNGKTNIKDTMDVSGKVTVNSGGMNVNGKVEIDGGGVDPALFVIGNGDFTGEVTGLVPTPPPQTVVDVDIDELMVNILVKIKESTIVFEIPYF